MSKVNHNIVAASVFSEDIKVVFVIVEEEFVIVEEGQGSQNINST